MGLLTDGESVISKRCETLVRVLSPGDRGSKVEEGGVWAGRAGKGRDQLNSGETGA